jgi:hypothetical protein
MQKTHTVLAAIVLAGGLAAGLTACSTGGDTATGSSASSASGRAITVGAVVDDDSRVLAQTAVGDTQFVIAERDGQVRIGQATNGRMDGWSAFDDKTPAADSIVMSAGNSPDAGRDGIADTSGRIGADVVGLDVVTHDGDTVHAVVANGWFVAAWAGRDFQDRSQFGQTYVLHLADGSTKRIAYEDAPGFVD